MASSISTPLRIGEWRVDPTTGLISKESQTVRVEVRTMRLLLCLAEKPGEVVSIDELLHQVWPGVHVASESVYQAVTSLRRLLGDDARQPTYIVTVPRLGYRLIATVSAWTDSSPENTQAAPTTTAAAQTLPPPARTRSNVWRGAILTAVFVLCLGLGTEYLLHNRSTNHSPPGTVAAQPLKSIAVLPFLDLTEGMQQEEFADGMTEELIGRLSKIQSLHVAAPTSSFYYKGKQIAVPEIARALGVAYVLDGSVRKSGARLRVAARLIRADSGYVIWSDTYDRPFSDILTVQDNIADEVTKALKASSAFRAN